MTRYSNSIFILTALSMSLAGCGYFGMGNTNDPNKAYKSTNATTGYVAVPPDLNSAKIQNNYAIPDSAMNTAEDPSLMPPGSDMQIAQAEQQQVPQTTAAPQQPQANAQQATAAPATAKKATLSGNQMTINKDLKQTWAETGKALSSSGYSIVEQDASLSTYYVADKVASGGAIKRDTPIYQVQLQSGNQGTVILLMNSSNQPANQDVANRILGALRDKL